MLAAWITEEFFYRSIGRCVSEESNSRSRASNTYYEWYYIMVCERYIVGWKLSSVSDIES